MLYSKLEKDKYNNKRSLLITTHKLAVIKTIKEYKTMSNFLKTSTQPAIFWKPSPDMSSSEIPKSIIKAQKDVKDYYSDKIEKLKQERHEELVKKVEDYDGKKIDANESHEQ